MTGILAEIVAYKREFVACSPNRVSRSLIWKNVHPKPGQSVDLSDALTGKGCALISRGQNSVTVKRQSSATMSIRMRWRNIYEV